MLHLVLIALLFLAGCSGDVVGNVYVTMKSGDVKRTADVEVILLAASDQFTTEWAKATNDYRSESAPVLAALEEANARETALRNNAWQRTEWHQAATAVIAAADDVTRVTQKFHQRTEALIKSARKAAAFTDVNGRYILRGVPRGKYYLYALYRVFDTDIAWMEPIEVGSGTQTVDLSSRNAIVTR